MTRGQSLVELAVCAPVVMVLTLGAVATVQVVDARAGLEAATSAAAAQAARAPDSTSARTDAQARFASIVAGYPLSSAHLSLALADFSRTGEVLATSSGVVDISWATFILPRRLTLESRAIVPLEPWRSHRPVQ